MRLLLVGSGGREHALAAALARSPSCSELHCAPGNPGIARIATCHPVAVADNEGLAQLASELRCDLVVIGPEVPLVAGLADDVRAAGVAVFGPGAEAAKLEGSKAFAKDVMQAAGVPTARHLVLTRLDQIEAAVDELGGACVVKADGLAAGKGVVVAGGRDEAIDAARSFLSGEAHGAAGATVVLEELLVGEEVSLLALCDGLSAQPLLPARDYKRIGDGDSGPNTGGMGAIAPVPGLTPPEAARLCELAHEPVLLELERRGARFTGCLYAGVMLTADGPRILEFNVRFGDPETQAILPLLEGDLAAALHAVAIGAPDPALVRVADGACVSLVLASAGYPASPTQGDAIEGIEEAASRDGVSVFHSGTALHGGRLVTAGGRVLGISAVAPDLARARERAYAAAACVRFAGRQLRSDIGAERTASRV
jgi:phosphoribosylamine---glycine ligase